MSETKDIAAKAIKYFLGNKDNERLLYKPYYMPRLAPADEMQKIIKSNINLLKNCDKRAQELKTLVGRVIGQPAATGTAYYQIVAENQKTVVLSACFGLGKDIVMPNWGGSTSVPKEYVIFRLKTQEKERFLVQPA